MPDDLLTPAEAAKKLKIAEITLRKWRRANRGPVYYRLSGGVIRYDPKHLSAFLNQCLCGGDKCN